VPDIGSEQLGAVPGAHPRGPIPPSCLPCAATRASAARWRTCRSSSPSAWTTPTRSGIEHAHPQGAHRLQEGDELHPLPERSRDAAATAR